MPLLLLLLVGLAGLLKVGLAAQAAIALQARLDVCAVRLAVARASSLGRLARANQGLRLSALGIYAARGLKLAGPAGAVLGGTSELVLLRMNQGLALFQETELARAAAAELGALRCGPSAYSITSAGCLVLPPLAGALRREAALFPDVKGILVHRRDDERVAQVRCHAGTRRTTLELRGPARLTGGAYRDVYAE